jgi:hypothetical protein
MIRRAVRVFLPRPLTASTRLFSASSQENDTSRKNNLISRFTSQLTPARIKLAAGGGSVALLGISVVAYEVGSSFMSLTPYVTGYYGFVIGAISAGAINIGFNKLISVFYISPESAKKRVVDYIKTNDFMFKTFSEDFEVEDISGFKVTTGHLTVKNKKVAWSPALVELILTIKGSNNVTGLASCIATKSIRGVDIKSICIHVDGISPRFIAGSDDSIMHHKRLASAFDRTK